MKHTVIFSNDTITEELLCGLCIQSISSKEDLVTCISPKCGTVSHISCLAHHFRQTSQDKNKLNYLLPVDGTCPVCDFHCLWGDIVRKKKGCYENLPFKVDYGEENEKSEDDQSVDVENLGEDFALF